MQRTPADRVPSMPEAARICEAHTTYLASSRWVDAASGPAPAALWSLIERNHRYNCLLWNEEDMVRRTDVADDVIVANKRAIDRYNLLRNDAIEAMDEWILGRLSRVEPAPGAWFNSETAGSIIDRLSILSLKVFHHQEAARRHRAGSAEHALGQARAADLRSQREDLASALDTLLRACVRGQAFFKIYRQHKLYGRVEEARGQGAGRGE